MRPGTESNAASFAGGVGWVGLGVGRVGIRAASVDRSFFRVGRYTGPGAY